MTRSVLGVTSSMPGKVEAAQKPVMQSAWRVESSLSATPSWTWAAVAHNWPSSLATAKSPMLFRSAARPSPSMTTMFSSSQ